MLPERSQWQAQVEYLEGTHTTGKRKLRLLDERLVARQAQQMENGGRWHLFQLALTRHGSFCCFWPCFRQSQGQSCHPMQLPHPAHAHVFSWGVALAKAQEATQLERCGCPLPGPGKSNSSASAHLQPPYFPMQSWSYLQSSPSLDVGHRLQSGQDSQS